MMPHQGNGKGLQKVAIRSKEGLKMVICGGVHREEYHPGEWGNGT
jgi:hypothetical protein